jgi:hypothetical protein
MLKLFRKLFSREPQLTLNHSYFGRLLFVRGANAASNYWEGELTVLGPPGKVGLTIPRRTIGPRRRRRTSAAPGTAPPWLGPPGARTQAASATSSTT